MALSGGGYRATAWALGVLWALVDAGVNAHVTMISSVSGGSITNAHAALGPAYTGASSTSFEDRARAIMARLTGRPRVWRACLLGTILAWVMAWLLVGLDRQGVAVLVVVALALAFSVVGTAAGDLVFNRLEVWLYIDLLLGLVAFAVGAWRDGPLFSMAAIVILATVGLFRGPLVGWALGRSLRSLSPGRGGSLQGLNRDPLHVFLATELRAGHHAAFAPGFVYCYDLGLGSKPSLPLRTVVQASANLPGAFPTRWIRTAGMGLVGGDHHARWMALSDGGDYDNMADQWPMGLTDRINRLRHRPAVANHAPAAANLSDWETRIADFVVVASASGALGYRRVWPAGLPLLGELFGLLQVKDVLYDNGNSVRRERLIDCFDRQDPAGTLVHINSSPYWYARGSAGAERADNAIAWLDTTMLESQWRDRVETAGAVRTGFSPLGGTKTQAVVITAYAQTMVNLHIKMGTPLKNVPTFP